MGMAKLPLHERLHRWADEALSSYDYASIVALEDMNLNSGEKMAAEAKLFYCFANEIERDYTPKAVDANGEVWNIGDECLYAGKKAHVMGFDSSGNVFVYCDFDTDYTHCAGSCIKRLEERTAIEKVRDEMQSFANDHESATPSLLDGWVKDLTAYIDQQGKDE